MPKFDMSDPITQTAHFKSNLPNLEETTMLEVRLIQDKILDIVKNPTDPVTDVINVTNLLEDLKKYTYRWGQHIGNLTGCQCDGN